MSRFAQWVKLEIGHINPVSFIPFTAGYLFQLYK